jgi:CubicO group peptidase (beta-lactamase class C family)
MKLDVFFRPVAARPLAALRIGLPLLLLVHLAWISGDLLSLHGSRGLVPWELTSLLRDPWVPGLPTLAKAFARVGLHERAAIIALVSAYAGCLLALALGVRARLFGFLAWGLHLSLLTSGFASFYGVDRLANTFLFYLFVFPSGRAWTLASREERTIPVGCLWVMRLHLCIVYLAAGLDKAAGRQWWSGEAIWQTVSQPIFGTVDLAWMASHPWIPMLACWATLIVEVGYAILIWPHPTRRVWCAATIALHLGTCLFMGLVFFASVMILLTSCLFLVPEELVIARAAPKRKLALAALLVVPALPSDLGPLVRRLMARDRIPGVAVGVVERDHLARAGTFGERDMGKHLPVTLDTLFPMGSCSKAFTATAIALLADDGRVALDEPVRSYLADFSLADPTATATVTTRDLLTHRSGLPRHDLFWYQSPLSRDELYYRLRFLEPSGPPHARFRYDSLMFAVAGRIVERASGESWERFVEERILSPLGMSRTLLSADAMEADADHAAPYALRDGSLREIPMSRDSKAIAPAAAVHASVNDLARWLEFHATRSPALLHESTWRELHRPQARMPSPSEPEVAHPYYALGWIHESYRGHPLVVHNGAIDGFTVHVGFLPETGQGLVVLMNRDLATAALMALAYSAYDRLLGLPPIDWEKRLEETPDEQREVKSVAIDFPIASVIGAYEHPAYGVLTVRARGDDLAIDLRSLHATLVYRGGRRFLSREPITDGAPRISVWFSKDKLFVPLNFDEGDPVEVFTRVTPRGA